MLVCCWKGVEKGKLTTPPLATSRQVRGSRSGPLCGKVERVADKAQLWWSVYSEFDWNKDRNQDDAVELSLWLEWNGIRQVFILPFDHSGSQAYDITSVLCQSGRIEIGQLYRGTRYVAAKNHAMRWDGIDQH